MSEWLQIFLQMFIHSSVTSHPNLSEFVQFALLIFRGLYSFNGAHLQNWQDRVGLRAKWPRSAVSNFPQRKLLKYITDNSYSIIELINLYAEIKSLNFIKKKMEFTRKRQIELRYFPTTILWNRQKRIPQTHQS